MASLVKFQSVRKAYTASRDANIAGPVSQTHIDQRAFTPSSLVIFLPCEFPRLLFFRLFFTGSRFAAQLQRIDGMAKNRGMNGNHLRRTFFMNSALALIEPTDSGVVDQVFKRSLRDGEEKLMLAVLENATEDFQKYLLASDKRGKQLFQEAEEWILETNSPSFFSFENICEHLQLDPDYVRRGFIRWKAAKLDNKQRCANPSLRRA